MLGWVRGGRGRGQSGPPGHRDAGRRAGAGLHDRAGDPHAAPAGNDDPVGAAQQRRAQDRPQVVGVLDAVAQNKEGRLAPLFGQGEQILQLGIPDAGGAQRHPLVVVGAAELLQLARRHPLDHRPGFAPQRREIAGGFGVQAVGQQQGIGAGPAAQQFGDRVFAPDKVLVGGAGFGFPGPRGARLGLRSSVHIHPPARWGAKPAAPHKSLIVSPRAGPGYSDIVYHKPGGLVTPIHGDKSTDFLPFLPLRAHWRAVYTKSNSTVSPTGC